jgi:HSP20 family molecular chaperone IbpA
MSTNDLFNSGRGGGRGNGRRRRDGSCGLSKWGVQKDSLNQGIDPLSRDSFHINDIIDRSNVFNPFDFFWDNALNEFFNHNSLMQVKQLAGYPKINISKDFNEETNKLTVVVEAAVPGMGIDDIDVSIDADQKVLTISGDKIEDSSNPQYMIREIKKSKFSRMIQLSDELLKIEPLAEMKDGILKLTWLVAIEKPEEKSSVKKININGG